MLKIGDKVLCRYFNTPDHKFYGDYFTGIVENMGKNNIGEKWYEISKEVGVTTVLHRKEIKKILK